LPRLQGISRRGGRRQALGGVIQVHSDPVATLHGFGELLLVPVLQAHGVQFPARPKHRFKRQLPWIWCTGLLTPRQDQQIPADRHESIALRRRYVLHYFLHHAGGNAVGLCILASENRIDALLRGLRIRRMRGGMHYLLHQCQDAANELPVLGVLGRGESRWRKHGKGNEQADGAHGLSFRLAINAAAAIRLTLLVDPHVWCLRIPSRSNTLRNA